MRAQTSRRGSMGNVVRQRPVKQVSWRLPPDLVEAVKEVAERNGVDIQEAVEDLLRYAVAVENGKKPGKPD